MLSKFPIGYGTYLATGVESTAQALAAGYRLLDTAAKYENEEAVGQAIRESGIPRSEIALTTKLWRTELSYSTALKACDTSLQRLGVEYIDLYLIHWPANAKNYSDWEKANAEAWRALEELKYSGKVKHIGLSNFWEHHLGALLLTAREMPEVNQIEFHPGYTQWPLVEYCKKLNIQVQAWSPLARGKVLESNALRGLSQKYSKSPAQICLRWCIDQDIVPLPKSTHPDRIKENMDVFDFQLSPEEIKLLHDLPLSGFSGELPDHWPERVTLPQ
jgi:diketogulonate reductase-like aldo/keto reductase